MDCLWLFDWGIDVFVTDLRFKGEIVMPRDITDEMIHKGIEKGATRTLERLRADLQDWTSRVEGELSKRQQAASVTVEELDTVTLTELKRPRPR